MKTFNLTVTEEELSIIMMGLDNRIDQLEHLKHTRPDEAWHFEEKRESAARLKDALDLQAFGK